MRPLRLAPLALLVAAPPLAAQFQKRIYPAPTQPVTTQGLPTGTERFTVTTADGLTLAGLRHPASAGKPMLLVFHGNASSEATAMAWLAPLITSGYGIVAADYRGYSGNPGRPSEAGLAADADAFHDAARAYAGDARVIVVGHSLGGGVALGLARRRRLDAVVTVGTFTGLRALAPKIVRGLIDDRYDNLAAVKTLDEPFFLIHGLSDDVVSALHGKALGETAQAAGASGVGLFLRGEGHLPRSDRMVAAFGVLQAYLDGTPPPPLPDAQTFPFGRFAPR